MIPVSEPLVTREDIEAVLQVLESGWLSGEGPVVEDFETQFAAQLGSGHAVAVSSGSAALDATYSALELGPGDEVVMPTFTIISCITQIVRMGATPVLVDADPFDWNMNTLEALGAVNSRTRAVLAVHTYGLAVDLDPLAQKCSSIGIPLIEDSAEAHGLTYKGKPCGAVGDVGIFSFYANKTLTTGEGGMIVSSDAAFVERVKSLRNLGFGPERFIHKQMGWNMRLGSLQAALGISQLQRLSKSVQRKREIGAHYRERLEGIPDIQVAPQTNGYSENSYWVFGVVLGNSRPDARTVRRELQAKGVGTRPFFCPMNLQPVLQERGLFQNDRYPVAENLWQKGFYLPSGLGLSSDEIDYVCDQVEAVLR